MIGVVLGTGPSLTASLPVLNLLRAQGALLFGCNMTHRYIQLDVWLACDPKFHELYGRQEIPGCDQWHWDADICRRFGYRHVEGVWLVDGQMYRRDEYETPPGPAGGLWLTDDSKISLNHCSGAQLLNLACRQYRCDPVLLAGHDFKYEPGRPRHHFDDLSDLAGEYPEPLRKWSEFDKGGKGDDLLKVYRRIAATPGIPRVVNCTPDSALPWFEFGALEDFLQ